MIGQQYTAEKWRGGTKQEIVTCVLKIDF